ncbi:glycosyltransferase family 2 protein [Pedobacter gandavensis]|uniref:glycosyltransferase family 2 protein n=1 Tax=Pedobacter gandavensis TaxID=2679963 RepID=UPI00292ECF35|nr:glycosyltransferase family 2 protein [Pedobacter gandavensis]
MGSKDLKISIVTINYNNAGGLKETIQSVLNQDYPRIEYIVIDGGSTDGSKEVIATYKDQIHYCVTEPDEGIYNAMNKGIRVATGDYLLFLNSGDFLIDKNVIKEAEASGMTKDLVSGNMIFHERNENWCPPEVLTFKTFFEGTIPHPSTFIRRTLFDQVGLYNESNSVVSDWEFFLLSTCKFNCSYQHIDLYITRFLCDGLSSDPINMERILIERSKVLNTHFPLFLADYKAYVALCAEMKKVSYFIKYRRFVKRLFKFKKN